MSFLNIQVKARPIKIAFLVDYDDKDNLKKALTISSALWGGMYFAIIPVYKRIPRKYSDYNGYFLKSPNDIITGYLGNFDPDYLVNLSAQANSKLPMPAERVIKESDIFDHSVRRTRARGRSEVNYGIGIYELFDYVVDKEFKYERKVPVPVTDIQFGKRHDAFFGAVFGSYTDKMRNAYLKRYESTMGIKAATVTDSTYFDLLGSGPTVYGLCNSYIDVFTSGGSKQDYIFLMDMNSWQDIVDYRNLVCTGLNVLPIPIQLCTEQRAIDLAKKYIDNKFRQFNENMVFYSTNYIKITRLPRGNALLTLVKVWLCHQSAKVSRWP